MTDEAQGLSDETMEQLRLLSNSGKTDEKQLHFVFVGQPELLRRLTNPSLRQIEQRIGAKTVLNPLQWAECHEYVEQRLRAVNGATERIFKPRALCYLIRHSGGIPRRLNVLCHNAMLLAYSGGARNGRYADGRGSGDGVRQPFLDAAQCPGAGWERRAGAAMARARARIRRAQNAGARADSESA